MEASELAVYDGVLAKRPASSILFTGTGQVSEPQRVRDALLAAFTREGGQVVQADAVAARPVGDAVEIVPADGQIIDADRAVVAAGAWVQGLDGEYGRARAPDRRARLFRAVSRT